MGGDVLLTMQRSRAIAARRRVQFLLAKAAIPAVIGLTGYASSPSSAQLYWDTNGSTAGIGGSGTWNSTNTNWSSNSAGTVATTVWSGSSADFGGTGGNVTAAFSPTISTI